MKIGICVGNPPYQQEVSNAKKIDIWPDFLHISSILAKKSAMVHPGRWVSPKKQMKSVQERLINDGLKYFDYYLTSAEIFPGIGLAGGVTISCIEKNYNGKILYNGTKEYNKDSIFCINNYQEELIEKLSLNNFTNSIKHRVIGSEGTLSAAIFGNSKDDYCKWLKNTSDGIKDPIKIWASPIFGNGGDVRYNWWFAEKSKFKNIPSELYKSRKLMINKQHGCDYCKIIDKNSIGSNVFFIIPENDTDKDLSLLKSLFRCKTIKFLMEIVQCGDRCVRGFNLIPDYVELSKKLPSNVNEFTDQWFYKEFKFSKELQDYIENNIYIHPDNYGCK